MPEFAVASPNFEATNFGSWAPGYTPSGSLRRHPIPSSWAPNLSGSPGRRRSRSSPFLKLLPKCQSFQFKRKSDKDNIKSSMVLLASFNGMVSWSFIGVNPYFFHTSTSQISYPRVNLHIDVGNPPFNMVNIW